MLWLVFAVLTVATIAILVYPLVKRMRGVAPARVEYDIVVYREQLAEIDQEVERGLLTADEASAARAEVHRRMLAAEDAELRLAAKPARTDNRYAQFAVIAAIVIVPSAGAAALYALLGSPSLPGQAYDWRLAHEPQLAAPAEAQELVQQLKQNPSASGYQHLADIYLSAHAYEQAADADRRAIDLGATDVASWSELGEAEVLAHDGAVVPQALEAFTKALSINSHSERARFYIGLAEAQIGDTRHAVAIWRDLEKDSPADAPWLPMLRDHIAAFAKEGGFDPASVPPSPPSVQAMNESLAAMRQAMQGQGDMTASPAPPPNGD